LDAPREPDGVTFADQRPNDALIGLMAQSGFAGAMVDTARKTIFAKSGADYVRVATNVKKDDGSRVGVGQKRIDQQGLLLAVDQRGRIRYPFQIILAHRQVCQRRAR
jgi:hypothetical protein